MLWNDKEDCLDVSTGSISINTLQEPTEKYIYIHDLEKYVESHYGYNTLYVGHNDNQYIYHNFHKEAYIGLSCNIRVPLCNYDIHISRPIYFRCYVNPNKEGKNLITTPDDILSSIMCCSEMGIVEDIITGPELETHYTNWLTTSTEYNMFHCGDYERRQTAKHLSEAARYNLIQSMRIEIDVLRSRVIDIISNAFKDMPVSELKAIMQYNGYE